MQKFLVTFYGGGYSKFTEEYHAPNPSTAKNRARKDYPDCKIAGVAKLSY